MENQWFVGVDIGGTTIKMAFISNEGELIKNWEIPTNCQDDGKYITTDISTAINSQLVELNETVSRLVGIGVGAPGFINMETGLIYKAVNIGWTNYPLKERLESETGLPVIVDNDANLAAIGEMWRGAGNGARNLLAVTLGTGVGGGLIANGNILHGVNGMAGEIGHITSIPTGGAQCNCGKTGCLETIASATGIARLAREALNEQREGELANILQREGKVTAKDVFDAAQQYDAVALNVINEMSFHLGLALANLANATNPEKIVIGGGVSKAGDLLLEKVNEYFNKFALPRVAEGVDIAIATLGNDAGVIGGAWLIKQQVAK